jgi:arylformamidase
MKLIDVTIPLDANVPLYPGNTPFSLEAIKRISRGDSSNVSTLHMSAHGGTHVDEPRHFFDEATGTEALPLEMLVGRARVVEVTSRKGITADDLTRFDLSEDVRVLIKTANSRLWGSPEFHPDYVGVTESGARYLVDHGIKVVGVDYLSVEEFKRPGAPATTSCWRRHDCHRGTEPARSIPASMRCTACRCRSSIDGAPARVVLRRVEA